MGFLRKLLGLDGDMPEYRDYIDPEFRFSLRVPGSWRQTSLVPQFQSTGGRIALARSGGAMFNVSCGAPDPGTPTDKIERVERARVFLAQSVPGVVAAPLRDVATEMSGEANVARAEVSTVQDFYGLISILHKGIEYTLQYSGNERTRSEIEALIASFHLPDTLEYSQARVTDFWAVVDRLDATDASERLSAHDLLAQAGAEAVPAILASVNACNQAIMAAARGGLRSMELQINALCRRIELLGQIGDERGIPALLNALGDSAQAREISPGAQRLFLLSQEALVKLGTKSVAPIAKVLDTPGARIRLALVEVLEKIGDAESRRILNTMLDDPEEGIRVIARRAMETFDFNIERRQ